MGSKSMLAGLFLVVAGCAPAPAPEVDLGAERTALMEADKGWNTAVSGASDPADALVSVMTSDARFQFAGAPPAVGREAVQAMLREMAAAPGFSLTWQATASDVAASGDLGYTVGTYAITTTGPDGEPATVDGHYVTIWKKVDGVWRVTVDTGGPSGPPPAAE